MAENDSWSIELNLSGRKEFVPSEGIDRVPSGPYSVLIEKTAQVPKKDGDGPDNILFYLKVTEPGAGLGKKLRVYLPIDPTANELIADKWFTVACAVARDPAALQKGKLKHSPSLYNGKSCWVYVQDNPGVSKDPKTGKDRQNLQNVSFTSKVQYDKFKAEQGASGAGTSGGAASGGSMTVTNGNATPHAAESVELD
jgi:hypothetical protein